MRPNIFEISGLVANGAGKLVLPVDHSAVLYSRYKHVRGAVPMGASEGTSLSKLRALDNLIDRLIRVQGRQPIVSDSDDLVGFEVSGLIDSYRNRLHQALSSANGISGASAEEFKGVTLDLVA